MSYNIPTVDQSDILTEPLCGPDEKTFVHIADAGVCHSLRVKPTELTAFKKASGWNLPSKIGGSIVTRNYSAFCLGPDEWQLQTDIGKARATRKKLEKLAKTFTYSYADISQRNVTFKLTGPMSAALINIGCPLDLLLGTFPINKCTRTVFEDAEIMVYRGADDGFSVQTWRSFGPYLVSFFKQYLEDQQ